MSMDPEIISYASRLLMALGFGLALLANARARNWGFVVALAWAVFETFYMARYDFHDWVRLQLMGESPDGGLKHLVQMRFIAFAALLLCFTVAVLPFYFKRARPGRRTLIVGSLLGLSVLALELISLHEIDKLLYLPVGLFAVSAILYFSSGIILAAGAFQQLRYRPPAPHH